MATTKIPDCYRVLGIARDATTRDINSAYKKLALKHHPDKAVGEGSSRDEFQKIQQAVEILRDPISRQKHDEELVPVFYEDEFQFASDYTGWRPHVYAGRTMKNRYAFSYGNSVHMDPHSNESSEERAHWEHMRMFGQAVPESYAAAKPDWEVRVEVMDERIRREKDGREAQDLTHGEMIPPSPVAKETEGEMGGFAEEETEEDGHQSYEYAVSGDEEEYLIYEEKQYDEPVYAEDQPQWYVGSPEDEETGEECDQHPEYVEPILYDQEAGDPSSTEYETANQEDAYLDPDSDSGPEEQGESANVAPGYDLIDMGYDTTSSTSFYEAKTAQSTTATDREPAPSPPIPGSETEPTTIDLQLDPFIPYFKSKLENASHCYTPEDVSIELKGIVLETYCGWLESLRRSFSDARPLTTESDPQDCAHLGYWMKEFGCSECAACRRWRPLYVLTCPGCGIRRCVECKFAEWKV